MQKDAGRIDRLVGPTSTGACRSSPCVEPWAAESGSRPVTVPGAGLAMRPVLMNAPAAHACRRSSPGQRVLPGLRHDRPRGRDRGRGQAVARLGLTAPEVLGMGYWRNGVLMQAGAPAVRGRSGTSVPGVEDRREAANVFYPSTLRRAGGRLASLERVSELPAVTANGKVRVWSSCTSKTTDVTPI